MSGYAHLVLETLHFVSLSDSFLTNILSKWQNILAFFPISFLQTDLKSIKVDKKKFCTEHSANRALINFDHPFKWSTKEQRYGYFSRQSNFSRVNSKQVVTKQQLTCTGTLITWQSKSEQHKGKRTRDYKEKGSFLGLSESKMENRLKDTAESSLMIWRREQLRKGAHEHFIIMLYTLNGFFYFNASVTSPSTGRNTWGNGEEQWFFLTPGLKDDNFLPLALAIPMWKETLASEEKDECTDLQRSCWDKWQQSWGVQLLKPRVESISGCSD